MATANSTDTRAWFIADSDIPQLRAWAGWKLAFKAVEDDRNCIAGDPYLFETASGSFFVGEFRRLTNGYEAVPYGRNPLDGAIRGARVLGEYCGAIM